MPTNQANKPAHTISSNLLHCVIWRNVKDSKAWYTTQLTRSYKSEGSWADTHQLNEDDLLAASKMLEMAHNWIAQQ